MASITITLNCDNDAFSGENAPTEIARLLTEAARRFEQADLNDLVNDLVPAVLMDINGNKAGRIEVEDFEDEDADGFDLDAVLKALRKADRSDLQKVIEDLGGAAYDDEPLKDLMDSIVDSIRSGDIEVSTLEAYNIHVN